MSEELNKAELAWLRDQYIQSLNRMHVKGMDIETAKKIIKEHPEHVEPLIGDTWEFSVIDPEEL